MFEEVADAHGLSEQEKHRYVQYMRIRWGHEEELQCETGYADEWAIRFRRGIEYASSDTVGQDILATMDGRV